MMKKENMKNRKSKNKQKKNQQPQYRTIWISDVHLGSTGSQANLLARFLKEHDSEQLYLVGDIIDGWRLKSKFYWPQSHSNVIRRILTRAKRGTDVIYITGNHDDFLRRFVDFNLQMGNIKIVNEAVHETADGRKLMVTHGDMFDVVTRYHSWVALAGDAAYNGLMKVNGTLNFARRRLGLPYWSLSDYAKRKVKTAVNFIGDFEESVAHECKSRGLDGAVCGHIHNAEIREINGVQYYNTGDWVDSCTALVENHDGSMELLDWSDKRFVTTLQGDSNVVELKPQNVAQNA